MLGRGCFFDVPGKPVIAELVVFEPELDSIPTAEFLKNVFQSLIADDKFAVSPGRQNIVGNRPELHFVFIGKIQSALSRF